MVLFLSNNGVMILILWIFINIQWHKILDLSIFLFQINGMTILCKINKRIQISLNKLFMVLFLKNQIIYNLIIKILMDGQLP